VNTLTNGVSVCIIRVLISHTSLPRLLNQPTTFRCLFKRRVRIKASCTRQARSIAGGLTVKRKKRFPWMSRVKNPTAGRGQHSGTAALLSAGHSEPVTEVTLTPSVINTDSQVQSPFNLTACSLVYCHCDTSFACPWSGTTCRSPALSVAHSHTITPSHSLLRLPIDHHSTQSQSFIAITTCMMDPY
jgi:hypothetical protein